MKKYKKCYFVFCAVFFCSFSGFLHSVYASMVQECSKKEEGISYDMGVWAPYTKDVCIDDESFGVNEEFIYERSPIARIYLSLLANLKKEGDPVSYQYARRVFGSIILDLRGLEDLECLEVRRQLFKCIKLPEAPSFKGLRVEGLCKDETISIENIEKLPMLKILHGPLSLPADKNGVLDCSAYPALTELMLCEFEGGRPILPVAKIKSNIRKIIFSSENEGLKVLVNHSPLLKEIDGLEYLSALKILQLSFSSISCLNFGPKNTTITSIWFSDLEALKEISGCEYLTSLSEIHFSPLNRIENILELLKINSIKEKVIIDDLSKDDQKYNALNRDLVLRLSAKIILSLPEDLGRYVEDSRYPSHLRYMHYIKKDENQF